MEIIPGHAIRPNATKQRYQRLKSISSTIAIVTIHHTTDPKSPNIYEGMRVVVEVMSSATSQDLYTALRSPGFTSLCFWKVYSKRKKGKKENQRQDES
jgi:hypothetical protein